MQLGLRNEQLKEFAMFPSRFFVGLITKMFFFQFLLWSNLFNSEIAFEGLNNFVAPFRYTLLGYVDHKLYLNHRFYR